MPTADLRSLAPAGVWWRFHAGAGFPLGTGVEPVTARFMVWCSAIELTTLAADTAFFRTHSRHTRATIASHQGRAAVRRWNWLNQPHINLLSDHVQRRRWESNPLETALQAVAKPSGFSVRTSPAKLADDAVCHSLKVVVPIDAIKSGLTSSSTA